MTNQTPKVSKYATASGARAQQGANYFLPGHYLVLVNRVKENLDSSEVEQVIAETTILHTFEDSVPGRDYTAKTAQRLLKAGEGVDEVIKKTNKARNQRVKGLAVACSGLTEADFNEMELQDEKNETTGEITKGYQGRGIEEMLGEGQPFAGVVLEVVGSQVVKKDSKQKPDDQLSTSKDTYTRLVYKRRVPFAEVAKIAAASVLARFIPDLGEKVAAEAPPAQS